ncbi:SNARE associated Golgi protein [Chloroherpeton thalassium ATCC 35110]|uniref:SNARE associated Golgi protein n=1 Tax=Chloroherpeton thalassium (strain ATCC 35110 / GB-78) TaxID=517418 RepID=B3QYX4_CHLT3|nr:DedA family protein [Chloroherpeton thalassium]ACF13667.1 SNARE associated Golgi protein [Chloroherpeton thalassium ATCC 35110]
MLEDIISYLNTLDGSTIYAFLFLIAFLENVFPPIPGDVPVAFVGYLIATNELSFVASIASASAGSVLGFMVVYFMSRSIGESLYEEGGGPIKRRISKAAYKFFPPEQMDYVKANFSKYGYTLVTANRFLAGTRTLISVVAGFLHLNWLYVFLTALISAILWNIALVGGGYLLGDNWQEVGEYISAYGVVITIVIMLGLALIINRYMKNHPSQFDAEDENLKS